MHMRAYYFFSLSHLCLWDKLFLLCPQWKRTWSSTRLQCKWNTREFFTCPLVDAHSDIILFFVCLRNPTVLYLSLICIWFAQSITFTLVSLLKTINLSDRKGHWLYWTLQGVFYWFEATLICKRCHVTCTIGEVKLVFLNHCTAAGVFARLCVHNSCARDSPPHCKTTLSWWWCRGGPPRPNNLHYNGCFRESHGG